MTTLRQHVIISTTLANPNNFNANISLDFDPEEVIVRSVCCVGAGNGVFSVRSSLVGGRPLCTFANNTIPSTPNSQHRLVGFANNSVYNFSVFDHTGAIGTLATALIIDLEFTRRQPLNGIL